MEGTKTGLMLVYEQETRRRRRKKSTTATFLPVGVGSLSKSPWNVFFLYSKPGRNDAANQIPSRLNLLMMMTK